MTAKKNSGAVKTDESPEQIVEDVGADESRPAGNGAADVKASDQVSVEDDSHSTRAGEAGASPEGDGSTPNPRVVHDAAWAAQTPAKFYAAVTEEVLSRLAANGPMPDAATTLRAVLDATNAAIEVANPQRGDVYGRLPFHKALTPKQVKLVSAALGTEVDPALVVATTSTPPPKAAPERESDGKGSTTIKAAEVVRKFGEIFELVLSEDGVPYGVPVDPESLRVAKPLAACEGALRRAFWKECGETLTADAVKNALCTVSANAAEDAPRVVVKMRSSDEGDRVVIDLGRDTGELVEITAEGWRVVRFEDEDRPDTVWTRSTALRPLPIPERGGDRTLFATAQDLDPDSDIARLLWGWLLSAYLPEVASPIAWFTGAHGSAKTTRSRNLLALVDPVSAPSAKAASETDDNVRAATRFVVSMDNVGTKISAATSDWMARIVTGFADDRRLFYTNGEMYTKFIKRPMVVTSIVMPAGLGSDAVERIMRLDLPMIDDGERLTERELNERYEAAAPFVLGALFDDLAGVIAHRDEVRALVHQKVVKLARMADHSEVLHALDIHLGRVGAKDSYHETFFNSVKQGLAASAMDDPVVTALLCLVPERDSKWEGTPDDLYKAIRPFRPEDDRAGWPTSAVSLGRILKTKQVALRTIGIEVEQGSKKIGGSSTRWRTVMNVGVAADDVPSASEDAVDEALAPAEADAYRAARKEADAHTAHRILANGGRTQGAGCVVERVAACDYRIFSGSGDADPSLWDAQAQTYNGSLAKTWTELPIKMR